jgi:hypothetical protein
MDLPHWALNLRAPTSIEAFTDAPADPLRPPVKMTVKYTHPAGARRGPIQLTWYQGGLVPPQLPEKFQKEFRAGVLFIGTKGMLLASYTKFHLLPEEKFIGWQAPPQTIPKSVGHHEEWIRACKTGSDTLSPFSYAGELSEAVLLGNAAHRAGCRIGWDAVAGRATNCPQATEFLEHEYRSGWKL